MYDLHFTLNINRLIAKYTRDDPVYKVVKDELINNTRRMNIHLDISLYKCAGVYRCPYYKWWSYYIAYI
jgi:hypothetical protein